MSIADEIRKLQELHQAGALTDAEFAQAKARVLAGQPGKAQGDELRDELAELRRQRALDRLDREWDHERERYMVTSCYGNRYTPSKTNAVVMAVGIIGFGVLFAVMPIIMVGGMGGSVFTLIGVAVVIAGLLAALFTYTRASQYDRAYQRYQRQRALLLSGADDEIDDLPAESPAPSQPSASTAIQRGREPRSCQACGRTIPAGQSTCPHCNAYEPEA